MRSAADIAAEMDEGLKLLFERGLELAMQVQEDALAAEEPERRAKLALAFHRLSRSVRQTAALRMRLVREAERSVHERSVREVAEDAAARKRRRAHIQGAVAAMVWSEYEPEDEDGEAVLERLDGVLGGEADTEGFLSEDPQAQIERLCRTIGYTPPARPDDPVAPPLAAPAGPHWAVGEADGDWRSSA